MSRYEEFKYPVYITFASWEDRETFRRAMKPASRGGALWMEYAGGNCLAVSFRREEERDSFASKVEEEAGIRGILTNKKEQ